MRKRRGKPGKPEPPPKTQSRLPERLGELLLIATVVVVPLAISRHSANICDVKDVALAVGVSVGLSLWLLASLARGRLAWAASRLNLAVLPYVLWTGFTLVYSRYRYVTVSEFGRLAGHLALYWLVVVSLRRMAQVRRVIAAVCAATVLVCLYGFAQATGRDPVSWETTTIRIFSFLGNATYLATFLALVAPVAIAAAWPGARAEESGQPPPSRRVSLAFSAFLLVTAGLACVCLWLTVTVSPMIGLGLGMAFALVLVVVRGGWRVLRIVVPAVLLGLTVLSAIGLLTYRRLPRMEQERIQQILHLQDPYAKERELQWRVALDLFREQPIVGKGFGTFRIYSLERLAPGWYTKLEKPADRLLIPSYAHNEYLQVLAGSGVIGGIFFLALLIAVYLHSVRVALLHPDPAWRRLGLAIIVGVTAFLFQNFFGVTFRQTGPVTVFWLWLAVIAVGAASLPGPGADQEVPRLRELRFRPLSPVPLVAAGLALSALVWVISWVTIRPAEANVKLHRASAFANLGGYTEAARLADEAVRLSPYSAVGHYVSAYAWGRLGELAASPDTARQYFERSLASNRRALELLPGNAGVYYNLGVTYKKLGNVTEAEANLRRAVDLMPTSVVHQGALAELLLQQGKTDEAARHVQEAVRLAPTDPKCHLLAADLAARRGNYEGAVDQLEQAASLSAVDAAAWARMAELSYRLKKYDKAFSACQNWIRMEPGSARAYNLLGVLHFQRQSYQEAEKAFSRSVELDPGYPRARLNLAAAYGKLGRYEKVVPELERLIRDAPDTPEGQTAKRLLDGMRARASLPSTKVGRAAPGARGAGGGGRNRTGE